MGVRGNLTQDNQATPLLFFWTPVAVRFLLLVFLATF